MTVLRAAARICESQAAQQQVLQRLAFLRAKPDVAPPAVVDGLAQELRVAYAMHSMALRLAQEALAHISQPANDASAPTSVG